MIPNRSVLDWPKGVTVYKPEKCYCGYTVINPFLSRVVYLVSMTGEIVHTWPVTTTDDNGIPLCSIFIERQAGGSLLSILWNDPKSRGEGGKAQYGIVELDWDGNVVWSYRPPGDFTVHHDLERLSNGNTMILGCERGKTHALCEKPFQDTCFREIDRDGNVLWSWFASDHYDEFEYSEQTRKIISTRGGDIFHDNTLTVLPGNELGKKDPRFRKGNILGSQRHLGIIYIVDRETGSVVWHWGEDDLVGQHHPTMLANGNILVYDNGGHCGYPSRHRPKTRLVELDPATCEIVWEYGYEYHRRVSAKFFGMSWGSAQRLPNGNTLSLDTHSGRVFEVTSRGETVWEYVNPYPWGAVLGNQNKTETEYGMYRVFRYAYEDFPEANPLYMHNDGFTGRRDGSADIVDDIGLPSDDLA